jgi:beta-lactamase regulating signal transducer with metallopeptidase domain
MIQEIYWIYAFNLIINSFLAFLTVGLLIRFITFVFRIKQSRFKAILWSLPLVKLALDPFLYDFHNWALMHQINPIEAETGSRMLAVIVGSPTSIADFFPLTTAIRFSVGNGHTFSPADIAALTVSPLAVKGMILVMAAVSFALLGIYLFRLRKSILFLSGIVRRADFCKRDLKNPEIIKRMKKTKSIVITSKEIDTPCAFGIFRKWICFPSNQIEAFSQDEFEAIVAHELHHLSWYDGVVRVLSKCIVVAFWWIPTRWLLSKVEYEQEIACDAHIRKFNIAQVDLASAILKTLKAGRNSAGTPIPVFSTCFIQGSLLSKRLQPLLEEPKEVSKIIKWVQICLVGFLAISFFFGRFWIF